MAEERVSYVPPAQFQVSSPLDYTKIKPGGIGTDPAVTEQLKKANLAVEDYAAALEQRFAQPNWFKVAAGFAKPQLGGFLASLGSAAEALGENVEAQRAIAPSIAKMRAEVEAGRATFEQRMAQKRMWDDILAGKMPLTPDTLNKLGEFGTDTDIFKTAKDYYAQKQQQQQVVAGDVGLQKAVLENPALVINDPNYVGATSTPEQSKQFVDRVNAGKPDYFSPREWATMTIPQKMDAIAEFANKKTTAGMAEGEKFALDAGLAQNTLDDLTTLRILGSDPSLAPLFSIGRSGDLFSQFRAFMEKFSGNTNAAQQAMVAAARDKLANASPEVRAKADKLIKGIAELEVSLRGRMNNPTNAASELSSARSPSLDNSQAGFLGIIDQLGLNAYRDIGIGRLHSQLAKQGFTAKDAAYSEQLERFRAETRQLRARLAKQNALDALPEWFDTRVQTRGQLPVEAAPASAAAETATQPAAPTSLRESLRAERERRGLNKP